MSNLDEELYHVRVSFDTVLTKDEYDRLSVHKCLRVEAPYEPGGDSVFDVEALDPSIELLHVVEG